MALLDTFSRRRGNLKHVRAPIPAPPQSRRTRRHVCGALGLVMTTAIFLHSFIHRQEADGQEEKVILKEKGGLLSYFQGFFHPFLCFVCILSNQRLGGGGMEGNTPELLQTQPADIKKLTWRRTPAAERRMQTPFEKKQH